MANLQTHLIGLGAVALTLGGCSQLSELRAELDGGTYIDEPVSIMAANAMRDGKAMPKVAPAPEGRTPINSSETIMTVMNQIKPKKNLVDKRFDGLRGTPEQEMDFANVAYDVEIFDWDAVKPDFLRTEEYDVILYETEPVNDQDMAFVKIVGENNRADWTACEAAYEGYMSMVGGELKLNPKFATCMRNKGYRLNTDKDTAPADAMRPAPAILIAAP